MPLTKKRRKAAAAAAAAAAASTYRAAASAASVVAIAAAAVASDDDLINRNVPHKKGGRYLRGSALHEPTESVWARVWNGDDDEIFQFLSLPRDSFNDMVNLLSEYITSHPLRVTSSNRVIGPPRPSDLSHRKFDPKDIVAMTLKFITTTSEVKDLALAATIPVLFGKGAYLDRHGSRLEEKWHVRGNRLFKRPSAASGGLNLEILEPGWRGIACMASSKHPDLEIWSHAISSNEAWLRKTQQRKRLALARFHSTQL